MESFTAESVAAALTRYLDAEITADELRAYLTACDSAIEAGEADRRLSGPVGAAVLVLMELDEGVRPPADVRSTLESALRALSGEGAPRPRPRRNPIPRPKGARAASSTERAQAAVRQSRAKGTGKPQERTAKRGRRSGR
jgi:hypothetical protein